jgi:hypothetical protein
MRYSNLLTIVILGLFWLLSPRHRGRATWLYAAGVLAGMTPLLLFNQHYLGHPLRTSYSGEELVSWTADYPLGLLGLLASPSKGLFVLSPFFLPCLAFLAGWLWQGRRRGHLGTLETLASLSFAIFAVNWLVYGKWEVWYGGVSWGPRLLADALPFIAVAGIPLLACPAMSAWPLQGVLVTLAGISIALNSLGYLAMDSAWHVKYDVGAQDVRWLFSLRESEPLFYIRRDTYYRGRIDRSERSRGIPRIYPTRFSLGRREGREVGFAPALTARGVPAIFEGVFFSEGRSPEIRDGALVLTIQGDGLVFNINPRYQHTTLSLTVEGRGDGQVVAASSYRGIETGRAPVRLGGAERTSLRLGFGPPVDEVRLQLDSETGRIGLRTVRLSDER